MLAKTLNTICPICKLCFSVLVLTQNGRREKEELLLTVLKHSRQKHNIILKRRKMLKSIKHNRTKVESEIVKQIMRS
jgi:hypothetical protein